MPNQIQRKGDKNDAGAKIESTKQTFVNVGGEPVATDGDPVEGHGLPPHASPTTANGTTFVKIGGIPINRQNDDDSCGHTRDVGSPAVKIG
tara:strand:+ start:1247 stop:1519 length:273 start_codon:yes stop_codon:yes gene_type:complete